LDPEELIAIVVDLLADLLARLERHEHELQVMSGVEDAAIVLVLGGQLLDVGHETLHVSSRGSIRTSTVLSVISFWIGQRSATRYNTCRCSSESARSSSMDVSRTYFPLRSSESSRVTSTVTRSRG